jgi:O-antigen ligase
MISEQPIFGWQPIRSFFELGRRIKTWSGTDAHNLYLHLLIEVGFVGMVPFLVGLWLCIRAAWKARKGKMGIMPLALLAGLLAYSIGGTTLATKTTWLLLALGLASAATLHLEQQRLPRVLVQEHSPWITRRKYAAWSEAISKQAASRFQRTTRWRYFS